LAVILKLSVVDHRPTVKIYVILCHVVILLSGSVKYTRMRSNWWENLMLLTARHRQVKLYWTWIW